MAHGFRQQRRRASAAAVVVLALMAAVGATAACSPSTDQTAGLKTETNDPRPALKAEINQFRDNYGNHIIELQLTNNSPDTVTVHAAEVSSALFSAPIIWQATRPGTVIPPGQTKSLPAQLPAASCPDTARAPTASGLELTAELSPPAPKTRWE